MSTFKPDPKPVHVKGNKPRRIVNPEAVLAAMLARPWCCACGGQGANGHHVIARGGPYFGDDVEANVVTLCGSGTMRCHGAYHGSPYTVEVAQGTARIAPDGSPLVDRPAVMVERRDAEWVARRVGRYLVEKRPDTIAYVLGKLGDVAGRDYLRRVYYIEAV